MAVILAQNSRNATAAIRYVLEKKPGQDQERYVVASGVGVPSRAAAREFARVRNTHGKEKGFVQAYCLVQSFSVSEFNPEDELATERANRLGRAVAKELFPGHQAIIVTQVDGSGGDGKRGEVHNHIIINAVHTETGRSIRGEKVTHAKLAREHDRVLEAAGFINTTVLKDHQADRQTKQERYYGAKLATWEMKQQTGETATKQPPKPVEMLLKSSIREALDNPAVVDFPSFVSACKAVGVDVNQRGGKGRGVTYALIGDGGEVRKGTARRATSLGTDFSMAAIEDAAMRHQEAAKTEEMLLISSALNQIMTTRFFTSAKAFGRECADAGILLQQDLTDKDHIIYGFADSNPRVTVNSRELGEEFTHTGIRRAAKEAAELRSLVPDDLKALPMPELIAAAKESDEAEYLELIAQRSYRTKEIDFDELTPALQRYLTQQKGLSL